MCLTVPKNTNELCCAISKKNIRPARTPNPCVWCNATIKFDALPATARKAGLEFEKFATGHYARLGYDAATGRYQISRGIDPKKISPIFCTASVRNN